MKTRNIKKLIVGLAFIAVAAIAAWNVSINSNKYGLSDISLANVEALAVEISSPGRWSVDVISGSHWICTNGGRECCPDFFTEEC